MINAPLLEDTMTHIRDNPELHNQSFYFERTELGLAACYAGRACLLMGYHPLMAGLPIGSLVSTLAGPRPAWFVAQDMLGLTDTQARRLFLPTNKRRDLELMVKDALNSVNHYDLLGER